MVATGTMGTRRNESPKMVEGYNVFKMSRGGNNLGTTEGSINNDFSPKDQFKSFAAFNEESYESKEIDLEDIYESEDS